MLELLDSALLDPGIVRNVGFQHGPVHNWLLAIVIAAAPLVLRLFHHQPVGVRQPLALPPVLADEGDDLLARLAVVLEVGPVALEPLPDRRRSGDDVRTAIGYRQDHGGVAGYPHGEGPRHLGRVLDFGGRRQLLDEERMVGGMTG